MRRLRLALSLGVLMAAPLPAQNTVRWNDVVRSLDPLDADPIAVNVWLDQRAPGWGQPIRVGFRVEEDAFVVVARVDGNGRLSVLFPAGRTRATEVKGGEDHFIRSNRLGGATFASGESPGATGYVFAIASRTPMDLTRLRSSDFSAWITGVPRMSPAARYFGDPYRVIQRFAHVVAYGNAAEFDYDLEYYSIDQPTFVTTSGYCGFGNAGSMLWRSMRGGWWNRGLMFDEYDPSFGYGGWGACSPYLNCLVPTVGMWGVGVPYFFYGATGFNCNVQYHQVATTGDPSVPPLAPPIGTPPVNPWASDSIGVPNVDRGTGSGGTNANGPHIMMDRPDPIPGAWNDRDDLSFSIPSRALRALGGANRPDNGSTPLNAPGASNSGPIPMPSRPTIEMTPQPTIDWVRPPRSFDAPPRDPVDRMPSLGDRRSASARGGDLPGRSIGRNDVGPPPRMGSPMFDREPSRNSGFVPSIRSGDGGAMWNGGTSGGMYSPPASLGNEGRPMGGQVYTGSSGPAPITTGTTGSSGTSGTSAPPIPPSGSSSSGTSGSAGSEKKPQQR